MRLPFHEMFSFRSIFSFLPRMISAEMMINMTIIVKGLGES